MAGVHNKLTDLNNFLFEQLERLNESNGEELQTEIERSKAICTVSTQIIANGKLVVEANKMMIENAGMKDEYQAKLPQFLEG